MSETNGSHPARPIGVVIGDALDELRERESRLSRFVDELREVRAAIKVLEKATGADQHPRPTTKNPAGETKQKILAAVRASLDPLSVEQIADLIGREPAGWLSMQVKRLVGAGELIEPTPGRYGVPVAVGTKDA